MATAQPTALRRIACALGALRSFDGHRELDVRCKPGDLAMVLAPGFCAGWVVRVLKLEDPPLRPAHHAGEIWRVDHDLEWWSYAGRSYQMPYAPDHVLLPLRGEPEREQLPTSEAIPA